MGVIVATNGAYKHGRWHSMRLVYVQGGEVTKKLARFWNTVYISRDIYSKFGYLFKNHTFHTISKRQRNISNSFILLKIYFILLVRSLVEMISLFLADFNWENTRQTNK